MSVELRVVAVSAGLSEPSSTRLLADRLAESVTDALDARDRAVEVRVVELRELAVSIANNLVTGFPDRRLRDALDAVAEADAVIAVTPVFTGSYSGLFKSFFDVLDRAALDGTPVLIAATGGTARHSLVLEHAMRPMFAYLRAVVLPTGVYAAPEDWGAGGGRAADLSARVARAGGELATLLAGRIPGDGEPVGEDEPVVPFEQQLAALRSGLDD